MRSGPVCLTICFAAVLAACETPAIYEPSPAAQAAAPAAAERPGFTPGDEFWFNIGGNTIRAEVYLGLKDGLHAFERPLQNQIFYYTPDMSRVRIERAFGEDEFFEPDDGELEFPLTPGKTWSREYRVRTENTVFSTRRRRTCEVMDVGQFQSQAGEFLAYRIACTLTELGEARPVQEEMLYAPAVGRIVHRRTLGGGTDLTLIEYTRANQRI